MSRDYIPKRQAELLAFVLNDSALLVATPGIYGITAAEAAQFNDAAQDFNDKMAVVSNPATKTKAAVQAKEESRLAMLYTIRPLLQYIKDNAGVADEDKVALGINIGDIKPTPVPPPASAPLLSVVAATTLQHTLRYSDATTPDKRAKPAGVTAMEVYCEIGDTPAISVDNAKFLGLTTRQPYVADFATSDIGKSAHYWGRWINGKGQPGPWSQPASMTIAG